MRDDLCVCVYGFYVCICICVYACACLCLQVFRGAVTKSFISQFDTVSFSESFLNSPSVSTHASQTDAALGDNGTQREKRNIAFLPHRAPDEEKWDGQEFNFPSLVEMEDWQMCCTSKALKRVPVPQLFPT